ncbi:MAG: GNAT family N-acetyltransferase [Bacteroidetes bacterium]|nr:GNAT family N-acetyltransferase [Bacteroidota bacterium]
MLKNLLFDSYFVSIATADEFNAFYTERSAEVYPDVLQINTDLWLSDQEKARCSTLSKSIQSRITLYFLIYHHEEPIGWHCAYQVDGETMYMYESGIIAAHRGRGIYTAVISWLLELFRTLGFQKVTSKHHASNNAVIVPKVKAGFMITGFTVDESVGLMVCLTYIFNQQRRNVYSFRTGYTKPDAGIKRFL